MCLLLKINPLSPEGDIPYMSDSRFSELSIIKSYSPFFDLEEMIGYAGVVGKPPDIFKGVFFCC